MHESVGLVEEDLAIVDVEAPAVVKLETIALNLAEAAQDAGGVDRAVVAEVVAVGFWIWSKRWGERWLQVGGVSVLAAGSEAAAVLGLLAWSWARASLWIKKPAIIMAVHKWRVGLHASDGAGWVFTVSSMTLGGG